MKGKTKGYEAIFCVVNSGFAENVMSVARALGAPGGTVIQARGTANPDAELALGITIHPDKEILIIVTPSDKRDDILHGIYREAGLESDAQGIAFSTPVTNFIAPQSSDKARIFKKEEVTEKNGEEI